MAIETKKGGKSDAPNQTEQAVEQRRAFFQETWIELKKTTWPTKQEANRLTGVVFGVIVAVSLFMGTLDWLLSFIISKFSLIK
jgi:preprotein translocase SecE subunit